MVTKLVVTKEIPFKVYSFHEFCIFSRRSVNGYIVDLAIVLSMCMLSFILMIVCSLFWVKTNKFRREKDTNTIRLWRCIEKECKIRRNTDFSDLMVLDGRFYHTPDEADTGNIGRQKIRESCKRKVKEESCERCSKFILSEIDNVETSDILMTLSCSKSYFSLPMVSLGTHIYIIHRFWLNEEVIYA